MMLTHIARSGARAVLVPFLAVISALVAGAVVIAVAGFNPLVAYRALYDGAFGSGYSLSETVLRSIPYMIIGLGVVLSFRAKMFNIGGEGQFYMGAIIAAWLGVIFGELPMLILIPFILAVSFIAGGFYGFIPGYLRARFGASEIVTTVMLNTIALQLVSYLVTGPLQEPRKFFPETQEILDHAKLPVIIEGTRLHAGIFLALVLVALAYIFLFKTVRGYQIRVVGSNSSAASFAGINVKANIILAMVLSGGLAGIAGGLEVLGITWKLFQRLSPGYGYSAIAVALLARKHPVGVIFTGLLFGSFATGANMMQRSEGIPSVLVNILQAFIIFFIVAYGSFENYIYEKAGLAETVKKEA
jgi:simple sugar transport system permease protein